MATTPDHLAKERHRWHDSAASTALLFLVARWSPARLALPQAVVFTLFVSVVTFVYLERSDFDRARGDGWAGADVVGGAAVLGLVLDHRATHRVNWSAARAWLWTGASAVVTCAGLGLAMQARITHRQLESVDGTRRPKARV